MIALSTQASQNATYLLSAVLFIVCLMRLSHPRTAVRGNLIGSIGMLLAIVATLVFGGIVSWAWIVVGIILGSAVGVWLAATTPMTGMPQMVGLLNGFGGGASVLVAGAELVTFLQAPSAAAAESAAAAHVPADPTQFLVATAASGFIGAITLMGSLVAYAKLAEFSFTFKGKKVWLSSSVQLPARHLINIVFALACLGLCVLIVREPSNAWFWLLGLAAGALGVLITLPIGGADMPVVVSLLNSYSGLAACATGFVINNNELIIAGSLVGASGIILTNIMCKAMNRSLVNVMFATMGPTASTPKADDIYAGKVKSASAEDVAMLLDGAQRVVIVPGYGLAVSQAQHSVRDFANLLEARGTTVEYAIHPVAGRMPGHMNVLLAEADIPYDKLKEMDVINPTMETVDVAIVVGANDVVNPVAKTDPKSPIAGMPIIDVDKARTVVVIKRSLSPGFAGIPNPLFAAEKTLMFFNDGKKAFAELIAAVKEL